MFNPRPHMLFRHPRMHIGGGGGGCHPPSRFAPNGDKASKQKPADSLGCFESNGTQFDLFRSYLDLPRSGQTKKVSYFGLHPEHQVFRE